MRPLAALTCSFLFLTACSTSVPVPPVEKIFPAEPDAHLNADTAGVDFNLDGTLSMQGFARPNDGKFSQLLQDLNLSFSALWKPDQIGYHRFGSIIEAIPQRPFYVAASSDSFYKGSKDYATTRIDKVFRTAVPGRLSVVMTDLFEQDLDISSIQQALKAAAFPGRAALAIWQWRMPFSGAIFDFDFRVHEGRIYTGDRYLYMLALGPKEAIEKLHGSIDRTVTIGKPKYLLLTDDPAKKSADWLQVTQTANAALKSRFNGNGQSAPYVVYRLSRGCSTAELTAHPQLTPASEGSPELSHPGTYSASLFALTNSGGKWSSNGLADPEVRLTTDRAGHEQMGIKVNCSDLTASRAALLRVRQVGTGNDVVLPAWVTASSASSMEFSNGIKQKGRDWGEKTLNLSPFVRGLASTATERTTMAVTYMYLVAN